MGPGIGNIDCVIGAEVNPVRVEEVALTPAGDEATLAVEDENRVVTSGANIDTIARIGSNVNRVIDFKILGHARPSFHALVFEVTVS